MPGARMIVTCTGAEEKPEYRGSARPGTDRRKIFKTDYLIDFRHIATGVVRLFRGRVRIFRFMHIIRAEQRLRCKQRPGVPWQDRGRRISAFVPRREIE